MEDLPGAARNVGQVFAEVAARNSARPSFMAEARLCQKLRGQGVYVGNAGLLALAFITKEEKLLVPGDGAADSHAELVLQAGGDASGSNLREGIAGQVGIPGAEVIRRAMEVVRSRLGLHGLNSGNSFAQLGVEVLRGDLGVGDGIKLRIHDDDTQNGILVVSAVQLVRHAAKGLSVDLNLARCLRVFIGRVGPAK